MAHTLAEELGSRGGIESHTVADLLYDLTDLYEDIHCAATGTEDRVISEALEKWRMLARETWDFLLDVEDADEEPLA